MAALRTILQLGNPLLRNLAEPVNDFQNPDIRKWVDDMLFTLTDGNGVGIAAPQIGVALRIVIIASRPTARYPYAPNMQPLVMFNPDMTVIDARQEKDWEGCLSVPGIRALVPRYAAIDVEYQNADGVPCRIELEGFPARVFQHEYDHLQGMVYLDRVEDNREVMAESEFLLRVVENAQVADQVVS